MKFIILGLSLLLFAGAADAQTAYPTRPVRVIVPFPAGGATDTIARLTAQKLSEGLGHQLYVENHGGAGGNIGMGMAATAPADGHTILAITNSFFLNPSLYAKIPYDPIGDFLPLTLVATSPYVITVHPSLPAKDLHELVALLRANPGKYSFASPGRGTPGHLAGELFRLAFGVDIVHVPFNGGGPAIQSTVAGHTQIGFTALPTAAPHVKEGTLRAPALMGTKRAPTLPDVPTLAELGTPGREVEIAIGIVVRKGTPSTVAEFLHRELVKVVAAPEIRQRLATLGFEPVGNTPAEFAPWLQSQLARWGKVIHDAGLKPE
jgi:tripartite-type tricarboxylate transporter receptor subunit TctC